MPERAFQKRQLPKSFTNDLFRAIEENEIPVTDFELTRGSTGIYMRSSFLWFSRTYSWAVTAVGHPDTGSYFKIAQVDSQEFLIYFWTKNDVAAEERSNPWEYGEGDRHSWEAVIQNFTAWLGTVREADAYLKMPDLWEELKQNKKFLTGSEEGDTENTPFTLSEQAEISAQIKQVRDYVKTNFELTSEQIADLDTRLDQAEEASRHLGRKDWMMLFNGAIFSLMLTDLITPSAAQHIILLTVQGLGHLFGFGGPPPHLPSGG